MEKCVAHIYKQIIDIVWIMSELQMGIYKVKTKKILLAEYDLFVFYNADVFMVISRSF